MSLLVVGSVAFDAVETPHGKVDRMLGGAATYFSVAASYFTHVNLVGIVGTDFTEKDESIFRGRHIDTQGLERADGKTFFWAGKYSENMNERTTLVTDLNVFADFKPKLPEPYLSSTHIFLANIHPELQASVLHQVKKRPRVVALDTMNYWIERTPKQLRETLKHTDILVINDSETRQLSNEHNLLRAARHIFKLGPKALVIKRGEYGAMLVHQDRTFNVPAFPLEEVHDPTGAGDSFAGGFMGYLTTARKVDDLALRRAMVYGSVMGSFAVEKFGLDRFRTLKKAEISARARHFHKMTQFAL
jgi:sugar/nucleoside kinase (ribokinase family)